MRRRLDRLRARRPSLSAVPMSVFDAIGLRWPTAPPRSMAASQCACAAPSIGTYSVISSGATALRMWGKMMKKRWLALGAVALLGAGGYYGRSEEHTSELQSLMRISYAV